MLLGTSQAALQPVGARSRGTAHLQGADCVVHLLHCSPGQVPLVLPKGIDRLVLHLFHDRRYHSRRSQDALLEVAASAALKQEGMLDPL